MCYAYVVIRIAGAGRRPSFLRHYAFLQTKTLPLRRWTVLSPRAPRLWTYPRPPKLHVRWSTLSPYLIRDRPSSPVAAQSLNRRRHWITGSVPRQRMLGPSSYRNRLNSTSVACMASAVAIFGDSILTCIASRSTWLLPNTSGLHPTDAFLLGLQVYLRSAVPAPPRPPYSLASPNLHTRAPTVPVIASEPAGFNLAHTFGGNCRSHRFGGPKSGVFIRSRGDGREEATETNRARPGTARKRHWPGNSITRRPNEYAG